VPFLFEISAVDKGVGSKIRSFLEVDPGRVENPGGEHQQHQARDCLGKGAERREELPQHHPEED